MTEIKMEILAEHKTYIFVLCSIETMFLSIPKLVKSLGWDVVYACPHKDLHAHRCYKSYSLAPNSEPLNLHKFLADKKELKSMGVDVKKFDDILKKYNKLDGSNR